MVKIFVGAGAAFLLAIFASYLLIPATVVFSKVIHLNTSAATAERAFSSSTERLKWWPRQASKTADSIGKQRHTLGEYAYAFPGQYFSGSIISIHHGQQKFNSSIHVVSFRVDSIALKWKSELPATNNPFKRISNYSTALDFKKNMAQILDSLDLYLRNDIKVYGVEVIEERVKDTILISTRWTSAVYPSTEMIYQKIGGLKDYIKAANGMETNYPMLNIFSDGGQYVNMVAIPVNKELPQNDKFVLKKMIPGKILTTEVTGGVRSPMVAVKNLEQYIEEHKLTSPAIPFESLITNRIQEKDSTKWVTKVYYPIY